MKKALSLFLVAVIVIAGTPSVFADTKCPKTIRIQVDGLKSTSAQNKSAIERIYAKGEKQTNKDYIAAVLAAVNRVESLSDVLRYSPSLSSAPYRCGYKGQNSRLLVTPNKTTNTGAGFTAALSLGPINYRSPVSGGSPVSHKGYAAELFSYFTGFSQSGIRMNQAAGNALILDLLVQIPLGDYGTDGYDVDVKIGQAASVRYSVVE